MRSFETIDERVDKVLEERGLSVMRDTLDSLAHKAISRYEATHDYRDFVDEDVVLYLLRRYFEQTISLEHDDVLSAYVDWCVSIINEDGQQDKGGDYCYDPDYKPEIGPLSARTLTLHKAACYALGDHYVADFRGQGYEAIRQRIADVYEGYDWPAYEQDYGIFELTDYVWGRTR